MLGLILDTSTERGIVAVLDKEEILFEAQLPFGLQNSHFLLPELDKQMKALGLAMRDLSYVACGTGPGSYTGIRVGVTAAKGIAFACRLPLIGVCTLEAFLPDRGGPFAVVADAKMGGLYLQKGIADSSGGSVRSGAMVRRLDEARTLLAGVPLLVTPYAGAIRPKLETEQFAGAWKWIETYPSPLPIGRAALAKINRAKGGLDAFEESALELNYLRKTQAEIEREGK